MKNYFYPEFILYHGTIYQIEKDESGKDCAVYEQGLDGDYTLLHCDPSTIRANGKKLN